MIGSGQQADALPDESMLGPFGARPVPRPAGWTVDLAWGLGIAAVAPAVFWPLLVAAGAFLLGTHVSLSTLVTLGCSIFAFLSVLYLALAARH